MALNSLGAVKISADALAAGTLSVVVGMVLRNMAARQDETFCDLAPFRKQVVVTTHGKCGDNTWEIRMACRRPPQAMTIMK